VSGVQIEIASQVERGTTLRAVLRIEAEHAEPGRECKHVLSINVYNPAGTYNWIYSTNQQVDAEGKVECAWPIPFNELTGLWKVVAKDVASGIQVTEMVEIV
jgi:hypothetical protein